MKIRNNPNFPSEIGFLSRELGVLWRELARSLNGLFESGTTDRIKAGTDTTDDVIVDDDTKGIVLKSPNGHYWRATISNLGIVTWTDLGTTKP